MARAPVQVRHTSGEAHALNDALAADILGNSTPWTPEAIKAARRLALDALNERIRRESLARTRLARALKGAGRALDVIFRPRKVAAERAELARREAANTRLKPWVGRDLCPCQLRALNGRM